jgi:hypothetical protein
VLLSLRYSNRKISVVQRRLGVVSERSGLGGKAMVIEQHCRVL